MSEELVRAKGGGRVNATMINGDCLEQMKRIGDETIDLILTDPPYNLGLFMKGRDAGLQRMRDNFFAAKGWDDLSADEWAKMMDAFFAESARVLKRGGSMIVFMAVIKVETVIDIAQLHGLYYKTTGTWHKTNPMPRNMNLHYVNSCESWVYFVNGTKTGTFNNGGKPMHDFMECGVAPKSERAYGKHPTQKPEALMMGFVETLTNQGDVVLDPFMGSGTSGVVSVRAGRQFIGIELSENYFAMANERVLAAESKQPTLWEVDA